MLSYEEFKNTFAARFPEVMGAGFEDYELKFMSVKKRGKTLDGFSFCKTESKDRPTANPTFYFNDIYENYLADPDITRHLYEVASSMKNAMQMGNSLVSGLSISDIGKSVIGELVNPEVACAYINDMPHREFLNVYIIYRWAVNVDDSGIYSVLIDNDLMEAAGLSEEDLYNSAVKNTRRLIVPQIKTFSSVIRGIMRRNGASETEIRKTLRKNDVNNDVWVLTNKHCFRGSVALIYPSILRKLAEKCAGDYYVFPSSVNESMIFPAVSISPAQLVEMLDESNSTLLNDDDQMLSDTIYYYDSCSDKLYIFDREEVRA